MSIVFPIIFYAGSHELSILEQLGLAIPMATGSERVNLFCDKDEGL